MNAQYQELLHDLTAHRGKALLGIVIENPAQSWLNSLRVFSLIFMIQGF